MSKKRLKTTEKPKPAAEKTAVLFDLLSTDQPSPPDGSLTPMSDAHDWKTEDKPGQYTMLDKSLIGIDDSYQREHIHESRVLRICASLSWKKFGVLLIARRTTRGGRETYWVFDGQHRKMAVDKRTDITDVPCLVFDSTGPLEESRWFLEVNKDRGPVRGVDSFKALIRNREPVAMSVRDMLAANGYVVRNSKANNSVSCVGKILQAMQQKPDSARAAWSVCAALHGTEYIHPQVFDALFALDCFLFRFVPPDSVASPEHRDLILRATLPRVIRQINMATAFRRKGGAKVWADGLVQLLNRGRTSKSQIPSPYEEPVRDE